MSAHTPGPWAVLSTFIGSDATACLVGKVSDETGMDALSDEYAVCVVPLANDESRPNARLIAAAPDLLAALRGLLEKTVSYQDASGQAAVMAARSAIAKATGA